MKFTEQQQEVIDVRNCNVLVSAAAGSGKTAVLTRRILSRIMDDGVDIDRLLVVTYTRAAAAEMRERILNAIQEECAKNPENAHMARQSVLIHNAKICTIDSFCSYLLRNHFDAVGINPAFRVADEAELSLMRRDVLEDVLEEHFEAADPGFLSLADTFGKTVAADQLAEQVLKLSNFADSSPEPEMWLQACFGKERSGWKDALLFELLDELAGYAGCLKEALRLSELPGGPYFYCECLERECREAEALLSLRDFDRIREGVFSLEFEKLPSKRDPSVDPGIRALARQFRNEAKDGLSELKLTFLAESMEDAEEREERIGEQLAVLIELVLSYRERLWERKQEQGIVDFSDIEHLAYGILVENGEPTSIALSYRDYFEEIFIDEYQDSNLIQESILTAISREQGEIPNRFLVGDVKQSIYRFRQARPELIMEKMEAYTEGEGSFRRIDLDRNFRSREEVLDFVNFVFSQLMRKDVGGVVYDERAALKKGFPYPEGGDCRTELLLCVDDHAAEEPEEPEEEDTEGVPVDADPEILMIAKRIRELVGVMPVYDKELDAMRPARYGDVAILMRSLKGTGEQWQRSLQDLGIPAYVSSRTGYFSAREVQTILQALSVFHNPLEDIPLFGLMRSDFGGFSDEEISRIRLHGKSGETSPLYADLQGIAGEGALGEKAQRFLDWIARYREFASYLPVRTLIRKLIYEEGYLSEVTAMPAGERRAANVEMLMSKAAAFEKTGMTGLHRFVRYMEKLQKYEVDYGEAMGVSENADVVRIMTVHNSKGLEFPICFLSRLDKQFNRLDQQARLVAHMDLGAGMEYVDPETRLKSGSLKRRTIAKTLSRDILGEELRVLYVGMTRAREKLILTASVKDMEKSLTACSAVLDSGELLLTGPQILGARKFLDWVLMALVRHPAMKELLEKAGLSGKSGSLFPKEPPALAVRAIAPRETGNLMKDEEEQRLGKRERLQDPAGPGNDAEEQKLKALLERTSFVYPHGNLAGLYTKTTVSELKMAAAGQKALGISEESPSSEVLPAEPAEPRYLPKFLKGPEAVKGNVRGSAYHRVLELLPVGKPYDLSLLKEELSRLVAKGSLSAEERELTDPVKILGFLRSPVAKRLEAADRMGKLFREKPFVIGIPASKLKPEFPEEELLLIQGIIDVYFEEEGELVVLDYKTDRVSSGEELAARYKTQLDYYAEALLQLTKKRVKEKLLYSFALGELVHVG